MIQLTENIKKEFVYNNFIDKIKVKNDLVLGVALL